MKIEYFKPLPGKKPMGVKALLRELKPGQALRISTAKDFRSALGVMTSVGKERGLKFRTSADGECDVIIYIGETETSSLLTESENATRSTAETGMAG